MVETISQLEHMSKDELIDKVLNLENFGNDINSKFLGLIDHFNNFDAKHITLNSMLECNSLNNTQYSRREIVKFNLVMPSDIVDIVLEQSVCQALSLTGIPVEPDNLQACHQFKKKGQVTVKFR